MLAGPPKPNLGKHHLHREGDFILFVWNGELSAEEVGEVIRSIDQAQRDHGFVYILADTREAGRMQPEARRAAAEWRIAGDFPAIALFGARFPTRVILNTLPRAYGLVTGKPPAFPQFFATEAMARQWIEAQRRHREHRNR